MTIQEIQQLVAGAYGIGLLELLSHRRHRTLVEPRWLAIWLATKATAHSLPAIGRAFGKRDHTTIIHALRGIEARIACDESFAIRAGALLLAVERRQAVEVVA